MARVHVRTRPETGTLFLDFFYRGQRCREQTALADSTDNRARLGALATRIEREIRRGCFRYDAHFPDSPRARKFAQVHAAEMEGAALPEGWAAPPIGTRNRSRPGSPVFSEFAETWFLEMSPQWSRLHRKGVREVLDKNLIPAFGSMPVSAISKADVLGFRADLAKLPGRRAATLGAGRINKIMCFLRQILNEAADRHDFTPAFRAIKPLKQKKSDVHPFSLQEVQRILQAVRPDFRDYLAIRFFTGLRTCEVNGLKWKHIDLERSLILVRETLVNGHEEDRAKTETSVRDIDMLPMVREAIENRLRNRIHDVPWVFTTSAGNPVDAHNFSNRVWYPLLRHLELAPRRPYQTRHTAATLMLAAGENPEWIARTMGHSTTAMLFKVYSRFVPNLTRRDGQAFSGLINSRLGTDESSARLVPSRKGDEPIKAMVQAGDSSLCQYGAHR